MSAEDLTKTFIIEPKPTENGIAHFVALKDYLIANKRLSSTYAKSSLPAVIFSTTPEAAVQYERLYTEVAVRPVDMNAPPRVLDWNTHLGFGN